MVNPAVTPAFRRRLFAWLLASCAFCIYGYAQPTPVVSGETAACQGDSYFYSTPFSAGRTWQWTVSAGGQILQTLNNSIEVLWTGAQNSTQNVNVVETNTATNETGSDNHTVYIVRSVLTCENTVQASVDQDGISEILPDMLLEGTYNTYDAFEVQLFTLAGFPLGNSITCDHVGLTLTGKVYDPCSGNMCWSTIIVETNSRPSLPAQPFPLKSPAMLTLPRFMHRWPSTIATIR